MPLDEPIEQWCKTKSKHNNYFILVLGELLADGIGGNKLIYLPLVLINIRQDVVLYPHMMKTAKYYYLNMVINISPVLKDVLSYKNVLLPYVFIWTWYYYSFGICLFYRLPPRYGWNTVESGVKHHNPNPWFIDLLKSTGTQTLFKKLECVWHFSTSLLFKGALSAKS